MTVRELHQRETPLAFPAMSALRPRFASEEEFVRVVDTVQRREGYRLVASFDPEWSHAAAVAGFRTRHMLAWGYFLYVDDLSTLPEARRRGHARRLLDWLADEGIRLGCEQLHLDSGVGADRADAHRLYLNSGLRITSHHFARTLLP